jgi:hypothetical protein
MASLFDPPAYQDILRRLDSLKPDSPRQWGKMSVSQMLEHTSRGVEMATGKRVMKRPLLGKLISWMVRGGFLGPKPFGRNLPTGPALIIANEPEFAQSKTRLRNLLAEFHALGEAGCDGNMHGFFGKMSGAEWGLTQHKHVDHHLRQFSA